MNQKMLLRSPLFQPHWGLILYLGLVITTLHLEIPILLSTHFEFILFVVVMGLMFYRVVYIEKEVLSFAHPLAVPFLLVAWYAVVPLLTSFVTMDYFAIFDDGEYKSLVKVLLVAPGLYYFLSKRSFGDLLTNSINCFYVILGFYFLYRYLVLNEAREFDSRPLLHIRHGDPNFLCTFFSMMVPLTWSQAWKALRNSGRVIRAFPHLLASFVLMFCALVTESRMGIVALFLGLLFLLTRRFSESRWEGKIKLVIGGVLALVVAVFFIQSEISKRFLDIKDKSNSDRVLTYENGVRLFANKPFFGVGMHEAQKFFFENSKYPDFQSQMSPLAVHNTYLSVAAELGICGFAVFCSLLFWAWLKIRNSVRPERYFLMSSFLILFVASLTIGVAYKDLFILHIFILAALGNQPEESTV